MKGHKTIKSKTFSPKYAIYSKNDIRLGHARTPGAAVKFLVGLGYGASVKYRNHTLMTSTWVEGDPIPDDNIIKEMSQLIQSRFDEHLKM